MKPIFKIFVLIVGVLLIIYEGWSYTSQKKSKDKFQYQYQYVVNYTSEQSDIIFFSSKYVNMEDYVFIKIIDGVPCLINDGHILATGVRNFRLKNKTILTQ